MKSTELRIGNLIEVGGQRLAVNEIKQFSVYGNATVNGWDEEHISPIPLTEEWLERFGFEIWEMDMSAWWKKQNITLLPISEGFREMKYNTDIHHVHQLQNLYFALTGEELTIHE